MKKIFYLFLTIVGTLTLCSCAKTGSNTSSFTMSGSNIINISVDDSEYEGETVTGDFSVETEDGSYTYENGVVTITKAGSYNLSGVLEGYIYINATNKDEIELILNGVSIVSTTNSPIFINNADKVKIKSKNKTYNVITDNRSIKTSDDSLEGDGAIYAKCDLTLSGKGTLVVTGNYNNGVHTTKDLTVKNVSLKVSAVNNALKGNNSVTIEEEPTILLIASSDGIKTEDSNVSSKGNQKGTITITGGTTVIYSYEDAIDAAYDVLIEDGSYIDDDGSTINTSPEISIYTNKYAGTASSSSASSTMYLRLDSSIYNSNYKYVCHFFSDTESDDSGEWVEASYKTATKTGGFGGRPGYSNTYYFYSLKAPSSYSYFKVYVFASSQKTYTISNAKYSSNDGFSMNTEKDTLCLSLSSGYVSSSGWTSFSQSTSSSGGFGGMGGMFNGGNTNVAETTAKGIKADNSITINGGTIAIKAYDDGIHANYGLSLENGLKGTGNVTINGGNISIYASDDGLHAEQNLTITGGIINITYAYEGVESNIINISGGSLYVYATDDGLNAGKKANLTPQINVSGGLIDITVTGGDVDGIDSNGSYTQSGGVVITRGYGTSRMSTGLDCDGQAKITSGLLICFGKPETTLTTSTGISTQTISGSYTNRTYTIKNSSISVSTTNTLSGYNGIYIWSSYGNGFSITSD